MIIVNLHYTAPIAEIDKHLTEHRALLMDLCTRGIVVCSGPKNPRTGGIMMLNVATIDVAKDILSADPFYRENLATYDYTEFTPVKCAPEFQVFLSKGVA